MRINRYLALAGMGSRRACELLVTSGEVTVNGKTVTELATQIRSSDQVKVGRKLIRQEETMTAVLHKPVGYICTASDPEARKTIYDLIPKEWPRVFYVGRLDTDSEGLLIMTNDGALSQRLTHPRYKLPKTYEVSVDREFNFEEAPKLLKGMILEGQWAKFQEIYRLGSRNVKVVLTQGLKRQIRLMFWRLGYTVTRLVRTQVGELKLGRLRPGEWKILDEKDFETYFGKVAVAPLAPSRKPRRRPSGDASRPPRPVGPRERVDTRQNVAARKRPGSITTTLRRPRAKNGSSGTKGRKTG